MIEGAPAGAAEQCQPQQRALGHRAEPKQIALVRPRWALFVFVFAWVVRSTGSGAVATNVSECGMEIAALRAALAARDVEIIALRAELLEARKDLAADDAQHAISYFGRN